MQFTNLEKFELAVNILANVWKRNYGHIDKDLYLSISCKDEMSFYTAMFHFYTRSPKHTPGPFSSIDYGETSSRSFSLSLMEDDERLEGLVNEIMEEISQIKIAA